jgi:uncharacterized SAM-binding protein YcdF (DUF218 family)
MPMKLFWTGITAIFALGVVLAAQKNAPSEYFRVKLTDSLIVADESQPKKTFDAVYILGGNQGSLKPKFQLVAELYAQKRVRTVYILSRSGTTEFSQDLGRNLTNDEWSLRALKRLGVPKKAVKLVHVEDGFFGTYSEAKKVAKLAQEKVWKRLLLITSPHHTRRVQACFRHYLESSNVDVRVLASKKQVDLLELVFEYIKLKIYQVFLL